MYAISRIFDYRLGRLCRGQVNIEARQPGNQGSWRNSAPPLPALVIN